MGRTLKNRDRGLCKEAGLCLVLLLLLAAGLLRPVGVQAKAGGNCKVTFHAARGMLDPTDYSGLNMSVTAKTKIRLPLVPDVKGYDSVGWTTSEEGDIPLYLAGDTVTVNGNLRFYAVRSDKKHASVYLHQESGLCYKVVQVKKGSAFELPGMSNRRGKTFLGWSLKKGQTTNPQYETGESVIINRSICLYPVMFNRKEEKSLTPKRLTRWKSKTVGKTNKFQRVVFVGDSRTYHMGKQIRKEAGSSVLKKIYFISKPGSGIDWFDQEGLPRLQALAKEGTAVIFNIGVHDLNRADEYVDYLTKLGRELRKKGCTMFYMSVNPLNNKVLKEVLDRDRPEAMVRAFNAVLRDRLCSGRLFTYIDCYSYLMKTGYGTALTTSDGADKADDDGLHYTMKTYKRIFNYCMKSLYLYEQILPE